MSCGVGQNMNAWNPGGGTGSLAPDMAEAITPVDNAGTYEVTLTTFTYTDGVDTLHVYQDGFLVDPLRIVPIDSTSFSITAYTAGTEPDVVVAVFGGTPV